MDSARVAEYWGRADLGQAILDALAVAGRDLGALTIDDLAPADQFHGGGKPATERLAALAALAAGWRVLDVGGGLGGPARTLAVTRGCRVTVVDLTESYVSAGAMLTGRLGLADRVRHSVGHALALPFDDGAFDAVWTQNSSMNIADKERLYASIFRVIRPGGRLAIQEPMAGPASPPVFPLMWAATPEQSFLRAPSDMRALILAAGFHLLAWDDVTDEAAGAGPDAPLPPHSIQRLVMGERLDAIRRANERNRVERRVVSVQAVFERPG